MATQHIVVDGSNIATEGRQTPSLAQLSEAVDELRRELPDCVVTVVVDATFAHRIDPSELARFQEEALRGEYVSPPAGAIGRGDAFLLRIAEKVDATVLSNDSFQEFHGEHAWLFDRGRLLGATPVPGVGWIFVPRTRVRGPRSRVAVRDSGRARERVERAIAVATKEVVEPEGPPDDEQEPEHDRPRRTTRAPRAVNDPITFITFIADHPLGEELEGEVENFTSHGAVVRIDGVLAYAPLSGLGIPAPRSAREVLSKGERRCFAITALDPQRRGVELALPGIGVISGRPSEETVDAEVKIARAKKSPARRARSKATDATPPDESSNGVLTAGDRTDESEAVPATKRARTRRAPRAKAATELGADDETSPSRDAAEPAEPAAAGRKESGPRKKAGPVAAPASSRESGQLPVDPPRRRGRPRLAVSAPQPTVDSPEPKRRRAARKTVSKATGSSKTTATKAIAVKAPEPAVPSGPRRRARKTTT